MHNQARHNKLRSMHKDILEGLRSKINAGPRYPQEHRDRNERIKKAKLCNCRIDEYGLCKTVRREPNLYGFIKPGVCCCGNCWSAGGYLSNILPQHKEFIFKNFLPIVGFWRLGGCVLPRRMRSTTCVGYYCGGGSEY